MRVMTLSGVPFAHVSFAHTFFSSFAVHVKKISPGWCADAPLATALAMAAAFVDEVLGYARCDEIFKCRQMTIMPKQMRAALVAVGWTGVLDNDAPPQAILTSKWLKDGLRVPVNKGARDLLLEKVRLYMHYVFKHVAPPDEPIEMPPHIVLTLLSQSEAADSAPEP